MALYSLQLRPKTPVLQGVQRHENHFFFAFNVLLIISVNLTLIVKYTSWNHFKKTFFRTLCILIK